MPGFAQRVRTSQYRPATGQSQPPPLASAQAVSWAAMALPLMACAAVWSIDNASSATLAWLSALHDGVAAAASAWTALRLILAWRGRHALPLRAQCVAPSASLIVLYSLLAMQPVTALMASLLHGDATALFGIPIPRVVPMDQRAAHWLDLLHGWNAVLLLPLMTVHIAIAVRRVRRSGLRHDQVAG